LITPSVPLAPAPRAARSRGSGFVQWAHTDAKSAFAYTSAVRGKPEMAYLQPNRRG